MDSITQVLLGVTTSEVAFRRKLGKPANWLAAVSALLPDLDFLLYPLDGKWWFMTNHRGISHSFLFTTLASFPLAWLFWKKTGAHNRYLLFWACALVALITHPLLDLCTTYGTPVFLPFAEARFGWDFIGIVDGVYSSVLIAALLGCRAVRSRGSPRWAPVIALGGLILSSGYIGLGAWCHSRATDMSLTAARGQGIAPSQVEAFPMVGLVNAWRLVIETDDAFHVGRINFLAPGGIRFRRLPKEKGPLVDRASRHDRVTQYRRFARGMIRPVVVDSEAEAPVIEFEDMRYAIPGREDRTIWSVRVTFNPAGDIVEVVPDQERIGDYPPGEVFRAFWHELWH